MKYNKVLITGGAGFVGFHLIRRLLAMGKEVGVIDNLSRGKKENLLDVLDQINFYEVDLRCETGLLKIFEGYDLVFNLAALNTGVDFDKGRTELMFEENMLLQLIPLRVAGKTKSIKKFIQVSSASVYTKEAMEKKVPTPESADTSSPEESKLGYALAKKMGENLAIWYAQNSNLETSIARFVNVYGENDHFDDLGHFIPMMTRKILSAKKQVEVFGSGEQKRSFLYVKDAVNGLITLANKGKNGEAYNIDPQEEKSIKEMVELIRSTLNKKVTFNFDLSKPEGSKRRMLDSSKIRQIGWQPQISFADGLKKTILDIEKRLKNNHD
ncbi:MAG: NAD-dependent epimerase/dehydratase family protein [Patescibacteria group bacterium]